MTTAAARPRSFGERRRERRPPVRPATIPGLRPYIWVAAAAITIAAVSLLFPSTPNYDPWAWVIWGREIVHGHLVTSGGPTWKPLPMFFTTVFAPLGDAAPDMWLVVARAGGLMALAMAFILAARLTRDAIAAPRTMGQRLLWSAAPLLAGLVAAIGVLTLSRFVYDVSLGYSEGLLISFGLLAIARLRDGAHMQAFVFAFAASLDRPEVWPFLLLGGAWLWRRDPARRRSIAILVAALVPLWFLPDLIGSGSILRGVDYALYPRAAAKAPCPFCTEWETVAWPLVLTPFKIGLALALAPGLLGLARLLAPGRHGLLKRTAMAIGSHRLVLALVSVGLALFVEDALLTQLGSSGNDRYLFLPAAMLIIAGAAAWAWTMIWLATALARFSGPTLGVLVALLVCGWCFLAVSPTRGSTLIDAGPTLRALRYQAKLREDLPRAVRDAGGHGRLIACGPIVGNPSNAPLLAWALHTGIGQLQSLTGHVLIQSRAYGTAPLLPAVPAGGNYRLVADVRTVRIYSDCR
ncbi:MAG: hypothetical protein ACRDMX_06440 [Solirubrobacteraceae bacterium]